MSIRCIDLVWAAFPGSGSELLAMLAMADLSNDQGGNLFPSVAFMAKRMRCSESQARRVLHKLIASGWLEVVGNQRGGPPGATRHYTLNVQRLLALTGERATARKNAPPCVHAHDGSHPCTKTAGAAATQSVKQQPSGSVKNKEVMHRNLSIEDLIAEGVNRQHAEDWLQVRRAKRAPLTVTAWVAVKAEANKAGLSPAEAVRIAATRSWQGFNAAWLQTSSEKPARMPRECLSELAARLNREHDDREAFYENAR